MSIHSKLNIESFIFHKKSSNFKSSPDKSSLLTLFSTDTIKLLKTLLNVDLAVVTVGTTVNHSNNCYNCSNKLTPIAPNRQIYATCKIIPQYIQSLQIHDKSYKIWQIHTNYATNAMIHAEYTN